MYSGYQPKPKNLISPGNLLFMRIKWFPHVYDLKKMFGESCFALLSSFGPLTHFAPLSATSTRLALRSSLCLPLLKDSPRETGFTEVYKHTPRSPVARRRRRGTWPERRTGANILPQAGRDTRLWKFHGALHKVPRASLWRTRRTVARVQPRSGATLATPCRFGLFGGKKIHRNRRDSPKHLWWCNWQ